MRARTLAALLTTAVMVAASIDLNALQCSAALPNAALPNSPQAKTASSTPQAKTAQDEATKADDPTKKLGAFVGKWETEGAFAGGQKTSTTLECRWSPQGFYLVCDQVVRMAGEHRQFTVYSYDSKTGNYSYTTLADPGVKPSSGGITIKGTLWTYESSFENNGKTMMIRTTNEFVDDKTEVFKVASSDDGGAHWKIALEGKARKIGD